MRTILMLVNLVTLMRTLGKRTNTQYKHFCERTPSIKDGYKIYMSVYVQ